MEFTHKDLNVIYEDNHIIVVVKPQGIPSQADKSGDIDMLTIIKDYLKEKYNKPGNVYVGLVHRLDRPTGGVMIFAKTSKAAERLHEALLSGDMAKSYLTVVNGVPRKKQERLEDYLYKYEALNIVKVVPPVTKGAKKAVLEYNVLDTKDNCSLLWIKLETGRSHQIRVQLSNIGNCLLGDAKYGTLKSKNPYPLALWAAELKFTHPTTKERMSFRVSPDINQYPYSLFDIDMHLKVNSEASQNSKKLAGNEILLNIIEENN